MKSTLRRSDFYLGLVWAMALGTLGLCTLIFFENNYFLGVASFIIIPTIICVLLTGNILSALALSWINELFCGGSGQWAIFAGISGRWVLYAMLMFSWALWQMVSVVFNSRQSRSIWEFTGTDLLVGFYGGVFPSLLFCYSAFGLDNPVERVLRDVTYFFVLLVYFPMKKLVYEKYNLMFGWLVGGSVVVAVYSVLMAAAPAQIAERMYKAVAAGFQAGFVHNQLFQRAPLLTLLFEIVAVYLGVLFVVDGAQRLNRRVLGSGLLLVAISPLVVNYLRGPLMGIAITSLIALVSMFGNPRLRGMALRLLGCVSIVAAASGALIYYMIPQGVLKFAAEGGFESWLGDYRLFMHQSALELLMEEPWLGSGLGVALKRFLLEAFQSEDYLTMELQYHQLLYRTGIIGFSILMAPIIWLGLQPIVVFRDKRIGGQISRPAIKLVIALLLAILTLLISGGFNPYITTPYTGTLIAQYLLAKDYVLRDWTGLSTANEA